MMLFWILAGLMVVAALLIILPPLFGKQRSESVDRKQQNVVIAKERLQELEAERDNGELSEEEFSSYRDELEQSLLDDVTGKEAAEVHPHVQRSRQSAIVLMVLVPLAAIGLYLFLGNPALLQQRSPAPGHAQMAGEEKLPSIDTMVEQLAERLEGKPDDVEGWALLAQSYMSINDFAGAAKALKQLNRLQPDDPIVMLRYADALAMVRGGSFVGEPAELIRKAITIDSNNVMGLWLAGMVAAEEGDLKQAIALWRRLEPMLESDPRSLQEVQSLISRAESKLDTTIGNDTRSEPEKKVVAAPQLELAVSLAPQLAGKAKPDHTVFIIVRAENGPPMPLVAVRKRVADLPLQLKVDDSQVMADGVSLADFSALRVEARLSKSGGVKLQPGDMLGVVSPVTLPAAGPIELVINEER